METMLLQVKSDIHSAMNWKEVIYLVLFDLSTSFNMVNHGILLSHLETQFGINGTALWWIKSYLSDQMQSVMVGDPMLMEQNPSQFLSPLAFLKAQY